MEISVAGLFDRTDTETYTVSERIVLVRMMVDMTRKALVMVESSHTIDGLSSVGDRPESQ